MSGSHEWAVELAAFGKSYAGGWAGSRRWAVAEISLRLAAGQVLGLCGPNGSGKSTTLKALAGLVIPTRGDVLIFGAVAGSPAARAQVGYLPESIRFPTRQTGRELLRYCAGLAGVPARQVEGRVTAALDWAGLGTAADCRLVAYSKGMRQRLGLAQAIVHEPAVILLDEPASGLDPEGRLALVALIRDLARQGRTVVLSSHLLAQAECLCDRIALLGGGRLLAEGTPAELLGAGRLVPAESSPLEKLYLEKIRGA
jgi:ABC-type multidrug transport system ATPase subunit